MRRRSIALVVLAAPVAVAVVVAAAATGWGTAPAPRPSGRTASFDPRTAVVVGPDIYVAGASLTKDSRGVVAVSQDGGRTWSMALLDAPPVVRAASDGSSVWLATDCGGRNGGRCLLHGTAQGGWREVASQPIDDLIAGPAGSLTTVVHPVRQPPRLAETDDGGSSWHDVISPCPDSRVPIAIAGRTTLSHAVCGVWLPDQGWVALDDWLLVRRDHARWETISRSSGQSIEDLASYNLGAIILTLGGGGWLQANGHLYRTQDDAATWSRVDVDPSNALSVAAVAPIDAANAYVVLRTEGNPSRLMRGDSSTGWTVVATWPWAWP